MTVKGEQEWPGAWRGCWYEAERYDVGIVEAALNLATDDAEQQRLARLGRHYFETYLRPERMAERVIRECV